MTHDTSSTGRPCLTWPVGFLLLFSLFGVLEVHKHATWSHAVDVTLDTGQTLHGPIRWGWHNELHVLTQDGEVVTRRFRMITFPVPASLKR